MLLPFSLFTTAHGATLMYRAGISRVVVFCYFGAAVDYTFFSPHCMGCAQNYEDGLAETLSAIYVSMCDSVFSSVVVAQHGATKCCSQRVDLYASSDQTYYSFSLGWPTFNVDHI